MRTAVKTLAFAALVAGMVYADAANFVAGTWSPVPTGFSAHNTNVYARDLTAPAVSNFALYGINTPNSITYPPRTNEWVVLGTGGFWSSYVNIAAGELASSVPPGVVGQKNGLTGSPTPANQEFLFAVGGNSGKKAYCRAFSAMTATAAVYYANSAFLWPLESAANFRSIGADMVVSNINPCYIGLRFDGTPVKYDAGSAHVISGSVNTVAGGANNILANSDAMVYWRSNSSYPWEPLQNFYITGNGDFTGTYAGGTEAMVGMASGNPQVEPNSVMGYAQGPVAVLPEPMIALMGITGVAVLLRRKVAR